MGVYGFIDGPAMDVEELARREAAVLKELGAKYACKPEKLRPQFRLKFFINHRGSAVCSCSVEDRWLSAQIYEETAAIIKKHLGGTV